MHLIIIVLKSSSINYCGKKSLSKTSELAVPSEIPNAPMKSCYVVIEDIPYHYDAEKLETLEPCPENINKTFSCQNNERNHLEEIQVRQPIAWGRMKDNCCSQLDNAVSSKLHTENTITERLHFLEKTIYDEALKLLSQTLSLLSQGPNTALSLLYRTTHFRHKSLQQLILKNKPVFRVF